MFSHFLYLCTSTNPREIVLAESGLNKYINVMKEMHCGTEVFGFTNLNLLRKKVSSGIHSPNNFPKTCTYRHTATIPLKRQGLKIADCWFFGGAVTDFPAHVHSSIYSPATSLFSHAKNTYKVITTALTNICEPRKERVRSLSCQTHHNQPSLLFVVSYNESIHPSKVAQLPFLQALTKN